MGLLPAQVRLLAPLRLLPVPVPLRLLPTAAHGGALGAVETGVAPRAVRIVLWVVGVVAARAACQCRTQ